jgi:hypothetical protein
MKRIKFPSILALSFIVVALPFRTKAADTAEKPAAPAAADAAKAEKPTPYQGAVSAVDKDKKSFTVKIKKADGVLVVTDKTKILHKESKKPATFDDLAVGGYVSGSYLKDGDTLNAYSLHIWDTAPVKGEKKSKTATPAPATTEAPKQ